MKNYLVRRYQKADYALWNDFVSHAKNATFLFYRDFMEYHSDRFEDFSLLIFEDEKLLAVLPANISKGVLYSHQGLTYGGLLVSEKAKLKQSLWVFKSLMQFLHEEGIPTLHLKELPFFYTSKFSDELKYLFFLTEARLYRRDVLSVLDLSGEIKLSKDRKEGIKRGLKNGLEVNETDDFTEFWNDVLIPNLSQKHKVSPVHSLEEIIFLKLKFPKNIRQFNVYHEGKIVGGTTIFETDCVAHSQYISSNTAKNELGSLDFLHYKLISEVFASKKYFDFGISNENQGKNINLGLLYWKETFGSGLVTQDFYAVETANHLLLENVLL
ncbi:GNAT family N-acetyltransferase [Flavobacterium enshiense]|uniref:GNAT family N-acetyltransferase n=1 Tax=Flavobacterium enshiense TaxID=1341165 RepID=UPI00345D27BB